MGKRTLILDNGAYEIKAGYSDDQFYRSILNCLTKAKNERKRVYIGDQLKECKDLSSLFFIMPFLKGLLVNFETEQQIFNHIFGKDCFSVDFDETNLIFTEPHFNLKSIQEATNEILFEEFQFDSILRITPSTLSAYNYVCQLPDEQCQLVLDVGYSFTHVAPYCRGRKLAQATFRNSLGGKALTNYMKEIISYRQMHVMEETYVINQCKEDECFVSLNFEKDLKLAKDSQRFAHDYVLPDFVKTFRGYAREPVAEKRTPATDQSVRLNSERFTLPETLFRPSDLGIDEMGVSELIAHSINSCPEAIRPHLARNILLTGGSCLFGNFAGRVKQDVQSLLPEFYDVQVLLPADPINYAWKGGQKLAKAANENNALFVNRREYNEKGHEACYIKFYV